MRMLSLMVVTISWLGSVVSGLADQPNQPAAETESVVPGTLVTEPVDEEQLAALGAAVAAMPYERDNVFRYAERSAELCNLAESLKGRGLEFHAKVARVCPSEVLVEIEPAGKTRIVLMHARPPRFGNLRTIEYGGVPSASRFHIFSAPVGLRIGEEISFEVAKKLRRRDLLVMRGTIDSVPVWIDSVFRPNAVALMSDWAVVDVNPEPTY